MLFLNWRLHFLLLAGLLHVDAYGDNDLTAEIAAGRKECYYQTTKAGLILEVDYQVIDGGDLDIDFKISGPKGNAIFTEFRKSDGTHTIDPTEEGDYEICFDNSFSRITKKSVFFEIILDSAEDNLDEDGEWKKFISPDDTYGDKLVSLEESLNEVKSNNAKVIQLQGILRAFEAKDRGLAERNFSKINFWSVINVLVMLSVFALQIFMVRSMFSDKHKTRT